jgi:DNA-binding MarR family transcriptional regulator
MTGGRIWASCGGDWVHGRLKITELADMLIMERTSLVRALKPLQVAGWVVAERSDNGRAFDVTLSPSGLEKFAEAKPLWQRRRLLSKVKSDVTAPSGSATRSWN